MPARKSQHFVSQFLLRRFSDDGKSVGSLVFSDQRVVRRCSIAGQCARPYFYGRDGQVEAALSGLEGAAASVLRKIGPDQLEPLGFHDGYILKVFLNFQGLRTEAEAADRLAVRQAFIVEARKFIPEGERSAELERFNSETPDPVGDAISMAAESVGYIQDLQIKVILAPQNKSFVIADNPLVKMNQFVEARFPENKGSGIGVACHGLQWFLPISPHMVVALFDSGVYRYGSDSRQVVRASSHDVKCLNRLQCHHAVDAVYFREKDFDDASALHLLEHAHNLAGRSVVRRQKARLKATGAAFDGIYFQQHGARFNVRPSFVSEVGELSRQQHASIPMRKLAVQIGESVRAEVVKQREDDLA